VTLNVYLSLFRTALFLVVVRMVTHYSFPQLLPPLLDVGVKFVPVVSDGELLVVVDGNADLFSADWLI